MDEIIDGPYPGNTVRYLTNTGDITDFALDRNENIGLYVPNSDRDYFNLG
ncbi:MAG: hypothetical protein IPL46_35595 [Saprospiraceae bacterium]|nr:hypothetical protein [Saprospiraceae bacterium]